MTVGASSLDRHIPGDSPVHSADARVKLVLTLVFIVCVTSLPVAAWPAFAAMLALVWAAVLASGIGPYRILRRTFLALPFILIALPTVFTRPGDPAFTLDLGLFSMTGSDEGLLFMATLLVKSWTSVTAAALLTATTPYVSLVHALRALHVPAILVAILSFMYRYIFVLVEETQRLLRARSARSASDGIHSEGGRIVWRARVAGGMAGSLFIRTYDRSERVYLAMLARGFDGEVRLPDAGRVTTAAVAWGAVLTVVCGGVAVAARFVV